MKIQNRTSKGILVSFSLLMILVVAFLFVGCDSTNRSTQLNARNKAVIALSDAYRVANGYDENNTADIGTSNLAMTGYQGLTGYSINSVDFEEKTVQNYDTTKYLSTTINIALSMLLDNYMTPNQTYKQYVMGENIGAHLMKVEVNDNYVTFYQISTSTAGEYNADIGYIITRMAIKYNFDDEKLENIYFERGEEDYASEVFVFANAKIYSLKSDSAINQGSTQSEIASGYASELNKARDLNTVTVSTLFGRALTA